MEARITCFGRLYTSETGSIYRFGMGLDWAWIGLGLGSECGLGMGSGGQPAFKRHVFEWEGQGRVSSVLRITHNATKGSADIHTRIRVCIYIYTSGIRSLRNEQAIGWEIVCYGMSVGKSLCG